MGSTEFKNPRTLSSAFTLLKRYSPALGFLNSIDPYGLKSNYYLGNTFEYLAWPETLAKTTMAYSHLITKYHGAMEVI